MVRRAFGTIALLGVAVFVGTSAIAGAARHIAPPAVRGEAVTRAEDCPGVPTTSYDASLDKYSLYWQARDAGADTFYEHNYFGQGVDVALIDTGVADVHHDDGSNEVNVWDGPDLSFDSQAPYAVPANNDLAHADGYGHGTHLAGIIAGHDDDRAPYSWNDASKFTGVAPAARVVNMKVADGGGAVDVSQVIAAVDWVVQHRNDYGLHVRVLNLAYGLEANDTQKANALAKAVTEATKAGIVVVAAAGNSGHGGAKAGSRGLLAPAYASSVLAVGSYDNAGTPRVHDDDASSSFTSVGKGRGPDLVAPGEHIASLHVTGAESDNEIVDECKDALAAGQSWSSPIFGANEKLIRGSGTSQATAFTSGVVALMLSKDPSLTPEQVKAVLRDTARLRRLPDGLGVVGAGEINATDVYGVLDAGAPRVPVKPYPQMGGGDLLAARGSDGDALPCTTRVSVMALRGRPDRRLRLSNGSVAYRGGACSTLYNYRKVQGSKVLAHQIAGDIHGVYFDGAAHACDEEINVSTNPASYFPANTRCKGTDHTRTTPWTDGGAGQMWNRSVWTGTTHRYNAALHRESWDTAQWSGLDWRLEPWSAHRFEPNQWIHDELQGNHWRGSGSQASQWIGNHWKDDGWLGSRWVGNHWKDCVWA